MANSIKETAFNLLSDTDYFVFFSDDRTWIRRFEKFAEENPEHAKISHRNRDGSIVGRLSKECLRIVKPQKKRELSGEEKARLREIFVRNMEKKKEDRGE